MLSLACGSTYVHAWGFTGHEITAQIAQSLLTPTAFEAVRDLLPSYYNGSLSRIASWADVIKRRPEYRFSGHLHYVNPADDPPSFCRYIDGQEDCPNDECVVGAIRNYTQRLDPSSELDKTQRSEALRFLVHFIGDLHQPLHATGKLKGGNGAKAVWDGKRSSLHSIWDTAIIVKRIKDDFHGSQDSYVQGMLKRIGTDWNDEDWKHCDDDLFGFPSFDMVTQHPWSILRTACPQTWAVTISKINCDTVWPGYLPDVDLSGSYYDTLRSSEYPDRLLAMAGVRMANVLNSVLG